MEGSDGQSDDGDAQGHARGHRAGDPGGTPRLRVRDHGPTARTGFLGPRRGHRLRLARPHRAEGLRGCGEGPVRDGTATEGVFGQRAGAGTAQGVLEDVELPGRTYRTAPRR